MSQVSFLRQGMSGLKSLSSSIGRNVDNYHQSVIAKREVFASVDRVSSSLTLIVMAMVLIFSSYQAYALRRELI